MWNGYEDGYVFPDDASGIEVVLCKCTKVCKGGERVSRSTYYRHHKEKGEKGPSRRAVAAPLATGSGSSMVASKQSRPRSDSDEGDPGFEMEVGICVRSTTLSHRM